MEALFLTLITGVFFIFGMLMVRLFKNKNNLVYLATGFSFVIMVYLLLFDLLPEIVEVLDPFKNPKYKFLIIIFVLLGFVLLKLLDLYVPQHRHNHLESGDNEEEHNNHMFHIGFITAVSLIIHNMLEGISIYVTGLADFKLGLLMAISVGCHNFPLGTQIAVSMDGDKNKFTQFFMLSLLVVSGFIGALALFIAEKELSVMMQGIFLSLTLGMLLYICVMELWPEVKKNINNKEIKTGLKIGLVMAILLFLL